MVIAWNCMNFKFYSFFFYLFAFCSFRFQQAYRSNWNFANTYLNFSLWNYTYFADFFLLYLFIELIYIPMNVLLHFLWILYFSCWIFCVLLLQLLNRKLLCRNNFIHYSQFVIAHMNSISSILFILSFFEAFLHV